MTTYVADSNPSLVDGVTGEKLTDESVVNAAALVSTMDSVLNYMGDKIGESFWTAFGVQSRYTFFGGFVLALGFGVYAASIGVVGWLMLPLTILFDTLTLGAALTVGNFIGRVTWAFVKPLLGASLLAVTTVAVGAWRLIVSAATGAWGWVKSVFTGRPAVPPEERLEHEIPDSELNVDGLMARAITLGATVHAEHGAAKKLMAAMATCLELSDLNKAKVIMWHAISDFRAATAQPERPHVATDLPTETVVTVANAVADGMEKRQAEAAAEAAETADPKRESARKAVKAAAA